MIDKRTRVIKALSNAGVELASRGIVLGYDLSTYSDVVALYQSTSPARDKTAVNIKVFLGSSTARTMDAMTRFAGRYNDPSVAISDGLTRVGAGNLYLSKAVVPAKFHYNKKEIAAYVERALKIGSLVEAEPSPGEEDRTHFKYTRLVQPKNIPLSMDLFATPDSYYTGRTSPFWEEIIPAFEAADRGRAGREFGVRLRADTVNRRALQKLKKGDLVEMPDMKDYQPALDRGDENQSLAYGAVDDGLLLLVTLMKAGNEIIYRPKNRRL